MDAHLNYLQAFLTLAETLSFSKAAKALSVTQPSVSRQIKLLEDQLGVQLFLRDTHRVVLTPKGLVLKDKLAPHLKGILSAFSGIDDDPGELKGVIAIGTLQELGQSLIMEALLKFQANHPKVTLNVKYMEAQEILDQLRRAQLEFAVVPVMVDSEYLRCFEMFEEEAVLVTRKKNSRMPESWTLADPAPFILFHDDDPLVADYLHKFKGKTGIKFHFNYVVVNSHRSMVDALMCSDSYAVMPYHSIMDLVKSGKLKVVNDLVLKKKFYFLHHASSHMDTKSVEFKKKFFSYFKSIKVLT